MSAELSTKATTVAAQAWCTPTTSHITMIPELAQEFARIVDEYRSAIIWMSGASDFAEGGQAHAHWVRVREHLVSAPEISLCPDP